MEHGIGGFDQVLRAPPGQRPAWANADADRDHAVGIAIVLQRDSPARPQRAAPLLIERLAISAGSTPSRAWLIGTQAKQAFAGQTTDAFANIVRAKASLALSKSANLRGFA